MNSADIARLRLINQQIAASRFSQPGDLLAWMGAVQSQDYPSAKWALGVRLPGSTEAMIREAVDAGDVLRTHVLRPTLHLVAAADIRWMLALTAPRIKAGSRARREQQGLTDDVLKRSNVLIEKALAGGRQMTRDELAAEFRRANFPTGDNQDAYLLSWAELEGLVCSGAEKNGKPTFALLEERVPPSPALAREEALARLAGRYFASRGPATLEDFTWWSGLSISDARLGLELVREDLLSETIDGRMYWFPRTISAASAENGGVFALPAFDECILSYAFRSAMLSTEAVARAVSSNGVFRPTIVADGRVIGIWKRAVKKDKAVVEMEFIEEPGERFRTRVGKAFQKFGRFLEKDIEIICQP